MLDMAVGANLALTGSSILGPGLHGVFDGAVVIRGDGIVSFVGRDEMPEPAISCSMTCLCGGHLVVPGLDDAQMRFSSSALPRDGERLVELGGIEDMDDVLDAVQEHAGSNPGAAWVRGCDADFGGWSFHPTRQMLDAIVPDRPACILSHGWLTGWMNTLAISESGCSDGVPDPEGIEVCRDACGNPTGIFAWTPLAVLDDVPPARIELPIHMDIPSGRMPANVLVLGSDPESGFRGREPSPRILCAIVGGELAYSGEGICVEPGDGHLSRVSA